MAVVKRFCEFFKKKRTTLRKKRRSKCFHNGIILIVICFQNEHNIQFFFQTSNIFFLFLHFFTQFTNCQNMTSNKHIFIDLASYKRQAKKAIFNKKKHFFDTFYKKESILKKNINKRI